MAHCPCLSLSGRGPWTRGAPTPCWISLAPGSAVSTPCRPGPHPAPFHANLLPPNPAISRPQLDHSKLVPSDATLDDKRRYQADLKLRLVAATQPKKQR
jgi:hypothetical protein